MDNFIADEASSLSEEARLPCAAAIALAIPRLSPMANRVLKVLMFMDMGSPLSEIILLLTIGAAMVHDMPQQAQGASKVEGEGEGPAAAPAPPPAPPPTPPAPPAGEGAGAEGSVEANGGGDGAAAAAAAAPASGAAAEGIVTGLDPAKVAQFAQEVTEELCAAGFLKLLPEPFDMPFEEKFVYNLPVNLKRVMGTLLQAKKVFQGNPATFALAVIVLTLDEPGWEVQARINAIDAAYVTLMTHRRDIDDSSTLVILSTRGH